MSVGRSRRMICHNVVRTLSCVMIVLGCAKLTLAEPEAQSQAMLRIPEPDKTLSLYSSDELAIVTDESAEGGELPEVQRAMINNIFELEDLTAEELMTSRRHIRAIEHDADRADIAARIEASAWLVVLPTRTTAP